MSDALGDLPALRVALANAERMRDDALARCAAMQEQGESDRRDGQHHLRNMISVIRAIVRRTGEEADTVEAYCGLLDARLGSYLPVQAALARDLALGIDLELLILDELQTYGPDNRDRVHVSGVPVELTSRAAGLMVLAFHEFLAERVLADFDEKRGSLKVVWAIDGDAADSLRITWTDSCSDGGWLKAQSPWAVSLRRAIEHQLAAKMTSAVTAQGRSTTILLPNFCFLIATQVAPS